MDTATLLLELGAVIVVLAVAARVSHRIGLSPIPLYLLVGLALGRGGLYPVVTAESFIEVGAEVGVVLLLVMLGLEYSPEELITGLRSGLSVAVVDLVANFVPGVVAGVLLGWSAPAAIVLGGVTYISSSGIIAKVLDDLGWLANRETPLVLSLLVAEDLVMALYLPLLSAVIIGGSALAAGASLTGALLATATALIVAFHFGSRLSDLVFSRSNETLLLTVLGVTMVAAGAAETIHVSAAVGAFLVGIAFSGPVQEHARGLLRPLRDVFAATFFVFFGLVIDPGSIPPVLVPALMLAVVTAATKFAVGSWGAARRGVGRRGRRRAGALLASRGEFSIIIAEIGVAANLEPLLGALAATYVLLLAIGGPLAARAVSR